VAKKTDTPRGKANHVADNKKSSISTKSTCHLLNIKQPTRVNKRIKLSFRRTNATVNILKTGKSVVASMGLIDLSESGAGLFTNELLLKGSTVEVCITEPRLLKVKGVVAWSVPVQSGVHNRKYGFRSGMQFVFENEMQRAAVLEYIQSVNMDPLENVKSNLNPVPASGLAPEAGGPNVAFIEQNNGESAPAADGAAPAEAAPVAEAAPTEATAEAPAAEAAQPEAPVAEGAAPTAETPAEAPASEPESSDSKAA
jgi:hypothetical protein